MNVDIAQILKQDTNINKFLNTDDIKLLHVQYFKKLNKLKVILRISHSIDLKSIEGIKKSLNTKFNFFNDIDLICYHDTLNISLSELIDKHWNIIVGSLTDFFPAFKDALLNCNKTVENNHLKIYIKDEFTYKFLKTRKVEHMIKSIVKDMSQILCTVEIMFDVISKTNKNLIHSVTDNAQPLGHDNIIIGKNINSNIIPITEINEMSRIIAIKGDIFKADIKKTKSGKKIVQFYITDYASSITVKFFAKPKDEEKVMKEIKPGLCCMVRGEAVNDSYAKEVVIMAKDIVKCHKEEKADTAKEKRVELHLHTQMSAMDGVTSVSKLIERAAKWGHKAIAITDHGVVQAYPEAMEAAKRNNIKVIYGIEAYFVDDTDIIKAMNREYLKHQNIKKLPSYHLIILVRNQIGLKNLYKLISFSNLDYFYKKPRMPKSLIEEYREGLIIGSACEAGQVYKEILQGKTDDELKSILKFYDYLEIQPIQNNKFMIANGIVKDEDELKSINRRIYDLGKKNNIPVAATCDVHFMDTQDAVFRKILMWGQGYTDADKQAPLYFRTTDEMLKEFSYLGKDAAYEVVVRNTNKIADIVEDVKPIPDGTFHPKIDGAENQIKNMAIKKAHEIYGDPLPNIVEKRLYKELSSIINNGYAVLYLIAEKLVAKSLEDGYLVGSRGSVGSSFVATMSNITEVNGLPPHYICPKCKYSEFITDGSVSSGADLDNKSCPKCGTLMKKDGHDIPFETFLGFSGDKEPDIDLNFSGNYQPIMHKYTEVLFGKGHVFKAGTIGTVAYKTAYGFVKKYLTDKNIVVSQAEIERLTLGCTGIKRTTGQHPGGIMVVPRNNEIFNFTPIQHPADDNDTDIITTHFDYHSISGRLLKLDILGHDDPTILKMLQDLTGVDPKSIPLGNKKVLSLFTSPDALGVTKEELGCEVGTYGLPEFGTKFARQMLVDTKPKTFSDLVRISGLSHGTNVWMNNAQYYIKEGYTTLKDCIATRDDIMMYLIRMGLPPKHAFDIMEKIRKGIGFSEGHEKMMRDHNVPDWYIDSCKKIKYLIPKGHAVAYVIMAVRIAYFKIYYPKAYYSTYFTVRADDFDADLIVQGEDAIKRKIDELNLLGNNAAQKDKRLLIILEICYEMYRRGIKFLKVDIYKSDAVKFLVEKDGIRPPIKVLQSLGEIAAKSICEARKDGKFISKENLRMRSKLSRTMIDVLSKHGCLDGLPDTNQLCLF